MELFCPECMGTLESHDGRVARCIIHGGQFQILFLRQPMPMPRRDPNLSPPILEENTMCVQHRFVRAVFACSDCGTAICTTCSFDEPDGSHVCPACAARRVAGGPPASTALTPIAADARCVQHSHLQATAQCKACGAFMCDTCKFDLPGGIQLCPTCATTTRTTLSPKRKKMLIGSFALAGWCTLIMIPLLAGAFARLVTTKEDQQAFGAILMLFLLGPSIAGVALGVGVMDRRLTNTTAMWIAVIWNGLILAGFVLLVILGMMKGG